MPRLHTKTRGRPADPAVVCLHGLGQRGLIYDDLADALVGDGYHVVAVDLRGHGASLRQPPWSLGTHVEDLRSTIADLGIDSAHWIGHSFGAHIAAVLAAAVPELVVSLSLLDPAFEAPPDAVLKQAEIERLDWSFASPAGAVDALGNSRGVVNTPIEVLKAYAEADLQEGADGRLRFSHCPSTVVVGWSEIALPAPPVAQIPTLVVRPVVPLFDGRAHDRRYRAELGSALRIASVPGGHNVLWEAPMETSGAIRSFLASVDGAPSA